MPMRGIVVAIDCMARSLVMPAVSAGTRIIECCWCLGRFASGELTITM